VAKLGELVFGFGTGRQTGDVAVVAGLGGVVAFLGLEEGSKVGGVIVFQLLHGRIQGFMWGAVQDSELVLEASHSL